MLDKEIPRQGSVWRKFKDAIKIEVNEPQVASGFARIQYLFKKIRRFASTNDPISSTDLSEICDTTIRAFQVFRDLGACRPSERYESVLMGAEEDFLYLYRHLFEMKWSVKTGKKTDNPEDMLGRIFIRHMPYPESPCNYLWSEVFSIYSAKSRHRHMSIKKKSEEDAMLALYRTDLQFLENVVFAQYRIYQHLFEYAYDRCHYYRVRTIFDPIEKKRRWKLYYTADHWSEHRQDEKKFLDLAKEIDARYRLSGIGSLKAASTLKFTRDVFLAMEWFDGYRHFQGALSHLQSWGQFKRDSYSAKEAEIIIREFRKTFEAFEGLQDGKPSNWEYKTERKLAAQALGHIQMLCCSTWGPDSPIAAEYANLYRTNLKRLDKDEWAMLPMEVTEEEERREKERRRDVAEWRDRRRQRAARGPTDQGQKETRPNKQENRESERRKLEREQRRQRTEEWERQEEAKRKAEERQQRVQQERLRQEEKRKAEEMEKEKRRREERERQQEERRLRREKERERHRSKLLLLRAQLLWNLFENPESTWIEKQEAIRSKTDLFTFFKWLQSRHAPPETRKRQQFENLLEVGFSTRSPRHSCLQIIRIYHPDQNVTGHQEWKEVAEEITKVLNNLLKLEGLDQWS